MAKDIHNITDAQTFPSTICIHTALLRSSIEINACHVFARINLSHYSTLPNNYTERLKKIFNGSFGISFAGRTDKATIPQFLLEYLNNTFSTPEVEQLFEQTYGEKQVILFGEGYGPKIQKGGSYREDVSFILFDVLVGENYQERKWVEQTATMLGIDVVPIVLEGTIDEAIAFVEGHPKSTMGTAFMEGVVGRPAVEFRDRTGKRIIVKIKYEDFRAM